MCPRLQILLVLAALGVGCKTDRHAEAKAEPANRCGDFALSEDKIPDDWLTCQTDDDCTRAHRSCCGCAGDAGEAIAKAWSDCVQPECVNTETCSDANLCDNRPICSDGMCALVPLESAPVAQPSVDCAGYVAGSDKVPDALRPCASNEDCTLAQITCCPCSGNGRRVAVATAAAACISPGECPGAPVCSKAYVCDDHIAQCVEGLCTTVSND